MKKILKELVLNSKLAVALALAFFGLGASATNYPVSDVAYLRSAISSASAGDTITLAAGNYEISKEISVDKAITIIGAGWGQTVIKPASTYTSGRGVTLDGGASIARLTVTGFSSSDAGAGVMVKNGTVSWCCVSNNSSGANYNSAGAGISFSGGEGTIDHSIIADNSGSNSIRGGGIGMKANSGPVMIDTCLIYGNSGTVKGGGVALISSDNSLTIRNCTIAGNVGTSAAGGVYAEGTTTGTLVLINDIISGNTVSSSELNLSLPSGILNTGNSRNCLITGSSAGDASIVSAMSASGFISAAPQFANASANDYRLAPVSPARAAGETYTGIGTDLNDASFAATPSIGCYEVNASTLGWTAVVMDSRVGNICTDGTLKYAYTASSTALTVNGVSFSAWGADPSNSDAVITPPSSAQSYLKQSGTDASGVTGDYQTLLRNRYIWNNGLGDYTVTLNNLEVGKRYLFQLVAYNQNDKPVLTVKGSNPSVWIMPYNANDGESWKYGGSLICVFEPSAASQVFTLTYSAANPCSFNAIQVRELSSSPAPSGFTKKVEITLNNALATTEITTGLPALVRLSESTISGFDYDDFDLANGGDMKFTDISGNVLPHEVDTWNASGESLVWVKLPSTAANTKIILYYGGGTTSPAASTGVWSDYVAVFHLNETGTAETDLTVNDSTANAYTGTAKGIATSGPVSAKIGSGWIVSQHDYGKSETSKDGGGIYLDSMAGVVLGTQFTVSAWAWHYDSTTVRYDHLFARKDAVPTDANGWGCRLIDTDLTRLGTYGAGSTDGDLLIANTRTTWAHIAISYDGTTAYSVSDGVAKDSGTVNTPTDNGKRIVIGCDSDGSDHSWKGIVDEVRIRKGAYDINYLAAEYNAMNTGASDIFAYGAVQDISTSKARYSTDGGTSWTEVADVDTAYAAIKDQSSAAIIEVLANGAIFGSDYTGAQCDITIRTKPGVATCTLTRNAAQDAGHWYVTDGKTLTISDLVINSGTTPINGMLRVGTTKGSTAKAYLQTGCVLTSSSTTCSGEAIRTYGELHIDGGVIREWYVSGMYCCVVVPLTLSTTYITAGGIEDCVSTKTDSTSPVVFGGGYSPGEVPQHNIDDPLDDNDPARTVLFMSGGFIRNNRHEAATVGANGLIGCGYLRTFYKITGGEITGNSSVNGYLGVFYGAKPLLSGNPVIANNLNTNVSCNLYVTKSLWGMPSSKLYFDGNLTSGANIGVYATEAYSIGDVFCNNVTVDGFTGTEYIHNDRNPQLSVSIVDGKNLCWAGQTYAVSWSGGANATTVATVDGAAIASGAQVEDGKSVVFTVTPNTGYEFAEASYADWTKTDGVLTRTVPVNGAAVTVTIPGATEIVPMFYVGSQGYSSWEAAYAAVEAGGTIKVGANAVIEMDSSMSCAKVVMIDLNGNTLTWNPGGWVATTFTFVDSSDGHAGVLSLPSGTRNIDNSTLDLTLLTSSQLTRVEGNFKAATATTVVKFPSDMPLAACTPYVVNQVVGTSIVVQGNTYTWDGSKWARPTVAPSIGGLTATPTGTMVKFSLSDVVMGTDDEGESATSYNIYYAVTNSAGVETTSGVKQNISGATYSFNVTDFVDGNYTCYVRITTDKNKSATKSVAFTVDTTPVLTLGWTAAALTAEPTSIRTDGALIYAYTRGSDNTVNGVSFTGIGTSATAFDNSNVYWAFSQNKGGTIASGSTVSDANYETLLKSQMSIQKINSLTLKNLIPGNTYLVQLIGQGNDNGAEVYVDDPTVYMKAGGDGWPYGGTLVGVFVAASTTQVIPLQYVNPNSDWTTFNALQVRDVSPVETVEPQGSAAASTSAIQAAIDRAAPAHRQVNLSAGLFEIDAQLFVTNGVTLQGQGWEKTIVKQTADAGPGNRVMTVSDGATVRYLTITGGKLTARASGVDANWAFGGGVFLNDATISWCCISNNLVKQDNTKYGGGVGIFGCGGQIDHSIIVENSASTSTGDDCSGGGIGIKQNARDVVIDTCLIARNTSTTTAGTVKAGSGGGIGVDQPTGVVTIRNTTIVGNRVEGAADATGLGGAIFSKNDSSGKVHVLNCIMAGNTTWNSAAHVSLSSTSGVDYCIVDVAADKYGDHSAVSEASKIFVNAAQGDYHLGDASPAVGMGVNYQEINVDLDRVAFAAPPSVGCYEYVGSGLTPKSTAALTRQMIQDAIDAVAPVHGTVHLGEGLFEIDAQLYVTNGVTLTGKGYEKTVVKYSGSAGQYSRVINILDSGTLSHLTLTGGNLDHNNVMGAGVFINETAESATISWCCITNNINNRNAGGGIAFYKSKGTFRIDHTVLSGNVACKGWATGNIGGGAIGGSLASGSTLEIDTCLITSNRTVKTDTEKPWLSAGGGIGVYCADDKNTCTVRIVNTTIADNSAGGPGGGLYLGKTVNGSLVNDIFTDNTAAVTAGAGDANVAFVSETVKDAVAAKTANCFFGNGTTTFGVNPLSGDVGFVDAEKGDYHLSVNSPALAAGRSYAGIGVDLDNVDFCETPALGCYEYASDVVTPKFTPASGTKFNPSVSVKISATGSGLTIRYTTDGSTPTQYSSVYSDEIAVSETTTIKARVYDSAGNASQVVTALYRYWDSSSYDYYVSLSGNDANDGYTRDTAFRTIAHAVEVAKDGEKIYILPGTFEISEQITVTNAITITGSGWDQTIIKTPIVNPKNWSDKRLIRCIELNGGATLEHVTLSGGRAEHSAGAWVRDGTISWCCVSNTFCTDNGGNYRGGGVGFSSGKGKIDHCILTGNTGHTNYGGCGVGAYQSAGEIIVDTCLIYGNYTAETSGQAAGIGIKASQYDLIARNCTIVNNVAHAGAGGVSNDRGSGSVGKGNIILINCIVVDNKGKKDGNDGVEFNVSTISAAETKNCLFGLASEIPSEKTGCISGDPKFVDKAKNDYHIAGDSPALAKGMTYVGIGDTLDGAGFGEPPSIGCYESAGGFGAVTITYPAKHVGLATSSIISFKESGPVDVVTFAYGSDQEHLGAPATIATNVGLNEEISAPMVDLEAGTTYYYRFTATEGTNTFTRTGSFTPPEWDVLRFAVPKADVGSRSAQLSVTIMKLGAGATKAEVHVAWGTDPANYTRSVRVSTTATQKQTVSYPLSGLQNDTVYYYRFTGTNDVGDVDVKSGSFQTLPRQHLSVGEPRVYDITETTASLKLGIVTIGEYATGAKVTLQWGKESEGLTESLVVKNSAQSGETVTKTLSGLTANTLYRYQYTVEDNDDPPESATRSGYFMTADPSATDDKKSKDYPSPIPEGKRVTFDADNAGNPETLEVGRPYCLVDAAGYSYEYTSTVVSGRKFYFRNQYDLQYNASARIGDNYYLFLSDAVDAAATGDTIELLRNNYSVEKQMVISSKTLTIDGNDYVVKVAQPFVDKQCYVNTNCTTAVKNLIRIVGSTSEVSIRDVTIMGGGEKLAPEGYGTLSENEPAIAVKAGHLTMDHVTLTRSEGGLFIETGAYVYLDACNLVRNARHAGGGLFNKGVVVMVNSSLSENRSLYQVGGGAAAENNNGILIMNNCVICNNGSTEYGGALNNLQGGVAYMMNMTMAGNFSSNKSQDDGGGIGCHGSTAVELYLLNCILLNNYYYNPKTTEVTDSDIKLDIASSHLLYSVYGAANGSSSCTYDNCWQITPTEKKVFKGYSNFARTYEQSKTTEKTLLGPTLEADDADPDARYAPLTENNSEADRGTEGVYTYFDASNWRLLNVNSKAATLPNIKMSYKTSGGEMTALGLCSVAEESDLVTTYYETAFVPDVTERELGVIGASGFGSFGNTYQLLLLKQPVRGTVSDNLNLNGKSYAEGTEVTIVATPEESCTFLGWYDENDQKISGDAVYTFVMDSDKAVYALFSTPSYVHTFYNVICEQVAKGTHSNFPIHITAEWLKANYGGICPTGRPVDDAMARAIEVELNKPDTKNGLNHIWMNYVLGAMNPGDPRGRIWIKGEQDSDANTLKFSSPTLATTQGCGFEVRYRVATKKIGNGATDYDRTRTYWSEGGKSSVFYEDVSGDLVDLRVIDMIFIPTGYVSSCEYVTTVNTAGVMKVDSTKQFEILAAPWVGFSPTNSPTISAQNYIKASCLTAGDVLYVYNHDDSCYYAWKTTEGGAWSPLSTYQIENGIVRRQDGGETPENGVVPRGQGTWLERKNTMSPIYLYGQYDPTPVSTVLQPGFNLIAPPVITNYNVSKLQAPVHQGEDGDHMLIETGGSPINSYYNPNLNCWGWKTNKVEQLVNRKGQPMYDAAGNPKMGVKPTWTTEGLEIVPGRGLWYHNRTTASMTLWWADPSTIVIEKQAMPTFPPEPAPSASSVGKFYMTAEPPFVAVMTPAAPTERLHLYYADEDDNKLDDWTEIGLYEWNNQKLSDWRKSE